MTFCLKQWPGFLGHFFICQACNVSPGHVTKEFYICSSLLQLSVESSDFSQAENKITVVLAKGQLISECPFDVSNFPKKPTKI